MIQYLVNVMYLITQIKMTEYLSTVILSQLVYLININLWLSWRLQEGWIPLTSKSLSLVLAYDTLIFQVTLVTDKNHRDLHNMVSISPVSVLVVNNLITTNHIRFCCDYYYSTTNITFSFVYLSQFSGVTPGPQERTFGTCNRRFSLSGRPSCY